MSARKAIFLDRDGTVIHERNYLADPDRVELLPGALAALQALRASGCALVLISNQSGVGRGLFSASALAQVHARLENLLRDAGLVFDGVYYCLHAPWDACACRKPEPGMLRQAARELDIDLASSWMIGDKVDDVLAGKRAGCRTALLAEQGAYALLSEQAPDVVAASLIAASQVITEQLMHVQRSNHRAA